MASVISIVTLLKKAFPGIPLYKVDERLTSKMALKAMIDGGVKKKQRQNKHTIDMVSASLILQSFMEMKKRGVRLENF
jgi:putative Holliday junction resolvase